MLTHRFQSIFLCIMLLFSLTSVAQEPFNLSQKSFKWYDQGESSSHVGIHFYFFWSRTCPHCKKAKPFITQLKETYPWLIVHAYEVTTSRENVRLYIEMADSLHQQANSVPAFLFCEHMQVGFDSETGVGQLLKQQLEACYAERSARVPPVEEYSQPSTAVEASSQKPPEVPPTQSASPPQKTVSLPSGKKEPPLHLPGWGEIDAQQFSLPILTLIIAGLDAFNPCAFFVLLFLLSLLVHTRQRSRMLLIGGIFVFFSGLIYFLFMAAWLNVFLWTGELRVITLLAGLLAVVIASLNIKDFFWFKQGPSLTIPDHAKPNLYQRIRGLVTSTDMLPLIASTVTLAIVANAYELLCTAGFPMLYTRILTLNELSTKSYYLYLVLYNVVYVIPLLIIVLIFTYTLGSRKLAESEGRILKLISGLMMLGLGGILLIKPDWLTNLWAAAALLGGAVGGGVLIILFEKTKKHSLLEK